MKVVEQDILTGNKLVDNYINQNGYTDQFFQYPNFENRAWLARNNDIDKFSENFCLEERTKLANALKEYNLQLNCSEQVLKNIEKLKESKSRVVVTGQQAGMLTGGVFVLYKAITAINLAKAIECKTGDAVIPVFWVASEDHDYEEVNHTYWWNNGIEKHKLTKPTLGMVPVGKIPLPSNIYKILDQIEKNSITDIALFTEIRRITHESKDVGIWFAKLLSHLFSKYGLVLIDPLLSHVKKKAIPVLSKALIEHQKIKLAVEEQGDELKKKGYDNQLSPPEENQTPLFYIDEDMQRKPVFIEDDWVYCDRRERKRITQIHRFPSFIEENYKRFSPNVALRPIVQDKILPTIAYVAGPGEIAYYAQLKSIYNFYGMKMPIIYPRLRGTIISQSDYEFLKKHNIGLGSTKEEWDKIQEAKLKQVEKADILQDFDIWREELKEKHSEITKRLGELDSDLTDIAEKSFNKINFQIEYLEHKARQKHKKNNKQTIKEIENNYSWIFPFGKQQEMVISGLFMTCRYGQNLIDKLIGLDNIDTKKHKLIIMGGTYGAS
ncbi:bacillithiol biosynthesis cysteine-adding enzyme BshC [Desulfitispora alkaliphila]|uniref:bacillithiol biosynthesis cysteine-adding enzyme BshC n=1 Tax=Desulfitispora alkaliphila TaxID=622674 RepID=UPI003D1D3BCB